MFGNRKKPYDQSTPHTAKAQGDWAEKLACEWLEKRGLVLKHRNFRTKYGEIDLVMQAGECLIFVEVRYRKNMKFGSAEETITAKKCQRLSLTAQGYLLDKGYDSNTAVRFDAVAITASKDAHLNCTINWIQNILS